MSAPTIDEVLQGVGIALQQFAANAPDVGGYVGEDDGRILYRLQSDLHIGREIGAGD